MVKNLPAMQKTWVWSSDWEDLLEKGTATHSSILAWRIPWTDEPGGLQCKSLTWLSDFYFHFSVSYQVSCLWVGTWCLHFPYWWFNLVTCQHCWVSPIYNYIFLSCNYNKSVERLLRLYKYYPHYQKLSLGFLLLVILAWSKLYNDSCKMMIFEL